MAKQKVIYFCKNCGNESPRWIGKCPVCGEWNQYIEEKVIENKNKNVRKAHEKENTPFLLNEIETDSEIRIKTHIEEFDRVLGGGIVTGSVILLAGDPGIGKSTLMLQIAQKDFNKSILYITGEESLQQLKLRATRLGLNSNTTYFLAETELDSIDKVIEKIKPEIIIIDSIQTVYHSSFDNAPGSITQIKECTYRLMQVAKTKNVSVFIIGHITKDGLIAGPKILEHIVDTVLQFEGDNNYSYRILRSVKNRFGSTNEIGIFEMTSSGLTEVKNPSEIFLSQRQINSSGSTIVSTIEGSRPILIEVQALVTHTSYGIPQRSSTGFDHRRLAILLAVIEKRLGIKLGQYDVVTNIAGGVKVTEPAVDLGIISSVISSYKDVPINSKMVVIGEVGLSGEVRAVNFMEKRLQETKKLGFSKVIIPKNNIKESKNISDIEIIPVSTINECLSHLI